MSSWTSKLVFLEGLVFWQATALNCFGQSARVQSWALRLQAQALAKGRALAALLKGGFGLAAWALDHGNGMFSLEPGVQTGCK